MVQWQMETCVVVMKLIRLEPQLRSISVLPAICACQYSRACLCTLISTAATHCWLYELYGVLCLASHFMSLPGPTPRPRDLEQPLYSQSVEDASTGLDPKVVAAMRYNDGVHRHGL